MSLAKIIVAPPPTSLSGDEVVSHEAKCLHPSTPENEIKLHSMLVKQVYKKKRKKEKKKKLGKKKLQKKKNDTEP